MFETELKIFGVVNGDKTSRADGMLLQWKRYMKFNITIHCESIYFLSAEFKIKLLSYCLQHKK